MSTVWFSVSEHKLHFRQKKTCGGGECWVCWGEPMVEGCWGVARGSFL